MSKISEVVVMCQIGRGTEGMETTKITLKALVEKHDVKEGTLKICCFK